MKSRLSVRGILIPALFLLLFSCKKDEIFNKAPTADAGESQIVTSLKNPFWLKGSGKDVDGTIVGYLWSQLSGPNTALIENNASATTEVSDFTNGLYVFQLMVIDNDGATGVDTVSITVKGATVTTLKLQPHNNKNEIHFIGSLQSNGYFSADPVAKELDAGAWTWDGIPGAIRGAFKFDLSGIPANAVITSAKLTLYSNPSPLNGDHSGASNSGTNNAMFIQRITSDWSSSTLTWQTQPPSASNNQVAIPHTNLTKLDLVGVNVLNLVKQMQQSGNYGFMIKLQNEQFYNIRTFCSSKFDDQTKHPVLEISYTN